MYIEMRITSACQSVASAFSDAVLRHWLYHCRPWLLMPRSWIGWPNWLHSLVPHTRSWPLIATGVPVCAGGVVPVTGALRPDSLPAASRAVIVYVCVVEGASPLIVALVDPVPHDADIVGRGGPRQADAARRGARYPRTAGHGRRLGVAAGSATDAEAVDVGPAVHGGRGCPNLVGTGGERRVDRDVLPGAPRAGRIERGRRRDDGAVDRDVHRPVGGAAVGMADGQAGGSGLGGHDRPLDVAADHVVVVDEPGAGKPGVVGLDRALHDRGVLGLQIRAGRSDLDIERVDVRPTGGAGRSGPDGVGAGAERGVDGHHLIGGPRTGDGEAELV